VTEMVYLAKANGVGVSEMRGSNYELQRTIHGPQRRASCAPGEFRAVRALSGQRAAAERGR